MLGRTAVLIATGVAALLAIGGLVSSASQQDRLPPAADFGDPIDNRFFPLEPGTVLRYSGQENGTPAEGKLVVTHRTKMILGIRAVVVRDSLWLDGKPEERTTDWYAQDRQGNVWYLGEDSFNNVNGKWKRNKGSWLSGVDGARPGIIMEAYPHVGDSYQQEDYPGHAEDHAQVLSTDASVSVPFGDFDHALKTKEWTPLEPGVTEHKFYAAGIGEVRSIIVQGIPEEMKLVSVTS